MRTCTRPVRRTASCGTDRGKEKFSTRSDQDIRRQRLLRRLETGKNHDEINAGLFTGSGAWPSTVPIDASVLQNQSGPQPASYRHHASVYHIVPGRLLQHKQRKNQSKCKPDQVSRRATKSKWAPVDFESIEKDHVVTQYYGAFIFHVLHEASTLQFKKRTVQPS
jgi:hypothetical protein